VIERRGALLGGLALLLLIGGLPSPSFAACGTTPCVQEAAAFTAGSSAPTVVFASNITAGNCVALYILLSDTTTTISSVTTNFGGTSAIKNANTTLVGGTKRGNLGYIYNTSGSGATVTTNLSASVNATIYGMELSGCSTSDPYDGSSLDNQASVGTGTDAVTTSAITTTVASDRIFGQTFASASIAVNAGTGYTIAHSGSNGDPNEYQIQSSAGSIAATFTSTTGINDFQTGILALKPTGGGGGGAGKCFIGGGFFGPGCM
jgi:hypothetical protein